jgi:hypothetical protein
VSDEGGRWSIRAARPETITRPYLDRTMVLETTYRTPTGTLVMIDALAMGRGNRGHELGRAAPHLLLRRARCAEGTVDMEQECGPRPDACSLMIPLVGFLPATDPRVLATIDATLDRLTDDRGLVYRYRSHDGLEGEEGTFLLCPFWLAEALALAGQLQRARMVFERAAAFVNDAGLLSEEVDASTGELLGNFPEAFSHIGLVNAAWAISEAERLRSRRR